MQHPPKKQFRRRSRRLAVWLTAAVLTASAAFVFLLPAIRQRFPAQKPAFEIMQSQVRTLAERESDQLESITIFPDGESSYTLHLREGKLLLERPDGLTEINPEDQETILETVTQISIQSTVTESEEEAAEHLGDMGLLQPQCAAVVRYADGTQETLEVGDQIPGGADYYFRWSGAPGVYTCHSGVLESLSVQPNLLLPFEQPVIYGNLVQEIGVENANGAFRIAFLQDGAASLSAPHTYPLSSDAQQTLKTAVQNVRLGAYETALTQENCAFYGFDQPLCVLDIVQREGYVNVIDEDGALASEAMPAQSLQLIIGREEGEFFYTCAWNNQVYLVSRFLLETFVQSDWKTLVSRQPASLGDALPEYIVFETPGKTVEVKIVRTESVLENNQLELDAQGNVVYHTAVSVNGTEAPTELLDELVKRLESFTVEGDVPTDSAVDSAPRWRITLVADNGMQRVLEGFRLDAFSDAVAVDGVALHYVYDEAIDVLMTGLV